ncbi:MAG: TonB-dependent receptor [Calditrichaeota bacterium]|nr:TonB-dependent receptor [Calditrichota bacterium]
MRWKSFNGSCLFTYLFILLFNSLLFAQTAGKIAGRVTDKNSGEPLPGANITIDGTSLGASTDLSGEFYIINIPPGKYTVRVQMIGYETKVIQGVQVSINRTSGLDVQLKEAVMEGEEIIVVAERAAIKKDQTGSIKNVSSDQIKALPVENMAQVIQMQSGVVQGHFRGGRSTEVSYMIDGVQTTQTFTRTSSSVEIEPEAVQDLEVITGTFNAEYGRAMSGIVNMVTKDGGSEFHGSFSGYVSNYYTPNKDVFIGLKDTEIDRNKDFKIQLDGPIWGNKLTFFANFRMQDRKGHLSGIRRFEPDNYSNFIQRPEPLQGITTPWDAYLKGINCYSEHTGDNAYVPMNTRKSMSFMGKIAYKPFTRIKTSLLYNMNREKWKNYSHGMKYNPDGRVTNYEDTDFYLFKMNHLLSNKMFYDLKASYTNNFFRYYLYKDPFDPRYVSDGYSRGVGGFSTGGQDKGRYARKLKDYNLKLDVTWQATKNHSFKFGADYTYHKLDNLPGNVGDLRARTGDPSYQQFYYDSLKQRVVFTPYQPSYLPDSSIDSYHKEPFEYSGYIQDKMEFEDLVINLGLRYDYFNSNTLYPTDARNPDNLQDAKRKSEYKKAKPQTQISPRIGLSYTLAQKAVLHFSYGHFFQMPPLYAMYQNHYFLIPTGDFQTIHGNPNIKAERTVQYEMGLWQELMPGMSLEISVYYRDIYDLQTAIVVTTYSGRKYGIYSNKDYGNVKGLELKYEYFSGPISFFLNYTLQYTRGVADNPNSTFNRLGQSIDPISRLTPLAWDQRHTLNFSLGYRQKHWATTLITYFNSGLPYTYSPISESPLSKQNIPPNGEKRPATISLDLKTYYDFTVMKDIKLRLFLLVYNLLDRKNELYVNPTTGRAYTAIIRPFQIENYRSNFNDIYDSVRNPAMYSTPREVKLGLGIRF